VAFANDFESFRQGIDDLLRELQWCVENYEGPQKLGDPTPKTPQLSPGDCERIRYAILYRHDPVKVREQLWGTEMAESIGDRFLAQLAAADRELKPHQVGDLVLHALAGIPERP
jgi:hypothetical protein